MVGSNVFNVLFILGVSALLVPLAVSSQLIRFDVPLMIGVCRRSCSLLAARWRVSGGSTGVILLGRADRLDPTVGAPWSATEPREPRRRPRAPPRPCLGTPRRRSGAPWLRERGADRRSAWCCSCSGRAGWSTRAVVVRRRWLGVTELVIGLTVIAAGTSLPEVVTSILASVRGERDIAVGNVVGSNIFNLLGVLGLAGVVAPSGIAVSPAVAAASTCRS
ncbi:MAG: hypothetical protein U5K33_01155 [Halofilum sp. (in: g-proteobacteria)]|nr:hypothetical protein [Halofilum sp. (in: g-proteobacteria)]